MLIYIYIILKNIYMYIHNIKNYYYYDYFFFLFFLFLYGVFKNIYICYSYCNLIIACLYLVKQEIRRNERIAVKRIYSHRSENEPHDTTENFKFLFIKSVNERDATETRIFRICTKIRLESK